MSGGGEKIELHLLPVFPFDLRAGIITGAGGDDDRRHLLAVATAGKAEFVHIVVPLHGHLITAAW
jgi:hypothetical protein